MTKRCLRRYECMKAIDSALIRSTLADAVSSPEVRFSGKCQVHAPAPRGSINSSDPYRRNHSHGSPLPSGFIDTYKWGELEVGWFCSGPYTVGIMGRKSAKASDQRSKRLSRSACMRAHIPSECMGLVLRTLTYTSQRFRPGSPSQRKRGGIIPR